MAAVRKHRRSQRVSRQFIAFVVALLLLGGIIGGAIVGTVNALSANSTTSTPYGTRDGKALRGEPPYEYLSDSDFVPIDCGLSEDLQEYTKRFLTN